MSVDKADQTFFLAVGFELGVGLIAMAIGYWLGVDPRESIASWGKWQSHLRSIGLGIVFALPAAALALSIHQLPWAPFKALHAQLDQQLRAMFLSFHWSEWTTLCLAAGVCEELLFRGLIQQGISESGWFGIGVMNGVFAIAVGSLLFGLCHFLSWTYFFFATLFGTYFGLCFVWTGDLLVAMVAHSVYDMIILAWLLRSFQKSSAIDR